MSLNDSFFATLKQENLITEYYSGQNFSLCRVADWSIMAISTIPSKETDEEGNVIASTYFAWHIDKAFAEKIIENNALFAATMISKKSGREPDLQICTRDGKEILTGICNEVKNGLCECLIDDEFEHMLKRCYLKSVEPLIEKHGNPPVFSKRKYWKIMLAFFLYPLGLPWFFAGKRIEGLIEIVVFVITCVLGVITPVAIPFFAIAVINVFVFYFRLFFGKLKDDKGFTIITESRKKVISDKIQQYNDYKKELNEGN